MRGKRIQIALKADQHRPASEMAFCWRADDCPIWLKPDLATGGHSKRRSGFNQIDDCPTLNAGLVALCFVRGSGLVLLRNPIFFVIFQGGGGGGVRDFPSCGSIREGTLTSFYHSMEQLDLISARKSCFCVSWAWSTQRGHGSVVVVEQRRRSPHCHNFGFRSITFEVGAVKLV